MHQNSQPKNVLIFDSFFGRACAYDFLNAIPGDMGSDEISYAQRTDDVHCKIWQKHWVFYNPREIFTSKLDEVSLTNGASITACVQVVKLGLYSYLLQNVGKTILHKEMKGDVLNSVKWSRINGIPSAIVALEEDKELLTEDFTRDIREVYELSETGILLKANLSRPDTVLAALIKLTAYFE